MNCNPSATEKHMVNYLYRIEIRGHCMQKVHRYKKMNK